MKQTKIKFYNNGKNVIIAEFGLSETTDKYFSVTGTIGGKRPNGEYTRDVINTEKGRYQLEMAGCIHKELLRHFPELSDIIPLHLSDILGIPMHSIENGYYYYSERYPTDTWIMTLSEHLRISKPDCLLLVSQLDAIENNAERKLYFSKYCIDQQNRWKSEADSVILRHNLK